MGFEPTTFRSVRRSSEFFTDKMKDVRGKPKRRSLRNFPGKTRDKMRNFFSKNLKKVVEKCFGLMCSDEFFLKHALATGNRLQYTCIQYIIYKYTVSEGLARGPWRGG